MTKTSGALSFTFGVRTSTGTGGALTVVPFVSIALNTTPGASVKIAVDLLRADLATGAVTAIPDLRAEALFGNQAGGAPLLAGATAVGGLRTGLVLKSDRRPAFSLTLHNVTVGGRVHELLDISSPDAAVTALDAAISGALDAAITQFGAAGDLIGSVLGIRPPAGVTAVSATALLANPLNEITRYWRDLAALAPAMADVLGALRALIAQAPRASVPGAGTQADPWRVELAAPLILLAWRDGDALVIDAALDIAVPVLVDHVVTTTLRASLLRLGFTPIQVTFVGAVSASVSLSHVDGPLELSLANIDLTADALRAVVSWSPARGLLLDLEAPGSHAIISVPQIETEIALPIPVRGADGRLTIPGDLWEDVQALVAALCAQAEVPIIDELLLLIGWTGDGPSLPLATLVEGDAALAIRTWLADLLLDCDHVRTAMSIVARLLSGGLLREPLGSGGSRSPYRCPVAGDERAPALVAWLIPPCPPRNDPGKLAPPRWSTDMPEDGDSLQARLSVVAGQLPAVRDLLVGRDSLAVGFEQLITRWTDTDGVLAVPVSLPSGVTIIRRGDTSYDDLVAEGASGLLTARLFPTLPATVVHVGCEEIWRTDRPAGFAVDASGAGEVGRISAAGTGEWFVCLPAPAVARAARADRDAVAEQADRLTRVFAERTAPVAVVAYGAAAAAVIRTALTRTVIAEVVTVGAPWSAPSVTAFRTGLGADALACPRATAAHRCTEPRAAAACARRAQAGCHARCRASRARRGAR